MSMNILHLGDLLESATAKLNDTTREFFNSGATEQITVTENSTAFKKYRFLPRVLRDVSKADTSTYVFGNKITFPLCISPAGIQAMAHPDGELATSRACAEAGVNMAVSSFANYTVGEIRQAGLERGPIAHSMQMYTMSDKELELRMIKRAEAAGCTAIFLTADSPVLGVRFNEWRNDFRTPEGLGFPNLERTTEMIREQTHDSGFMSFTSDSHSWAREIPWLRSVTKMEIWIKGVLTPEDVHAAVAYGCDGVIISNHGGRQLDSAIATIDALPDCARAAAGRIRLHIDGGIRTGADIFKCLALGAECCWVGRPALWGLAHDGEAGVRLMLDILYTDFKRCMQLCGCSNIGEIKASMLAKIGPDGFLAKL